MTHATGPIAILLAALIVLAGCAGAPAGDSDGTPIPTRGGESHTGTQQTGILPRLGGDWVRTTTVSSGSEPLILADVKGKYLWVGDTSGIYYSTDNGSRWTKMPNYLGYVETGFIDGPGLAQDETGRLYAATLDDNRGDVIRSDDGKSFGQTTYFAGYPIDRPWVGARGTTVAVVYLNNFGATGVLEACTRSTDSGLTFVDRNPGAAQPGTGGLYMAPDKSFYYTSFDGLVNRHAQTCAERTYATGATQNILSATGVNNLVAMTGFGDKLYVAGADGDNAMAVGGVPKWGGKSVKYTVSPADLKTNTFGAVAAQGNNVAVAWYGSTSGGDPSVDGYSGTFHVYVALIRDYFGQEGEPTIQLWKVSDDPNHRGPICMGGVACTGNRGLLDYFGVAFDIWGGIHVAYVDDTSGPKTLHAHIVADSAGDPVTTDGPTLPNATKDPDGTSKPGSKPAARIQGDIQGLTLRLDASGSSGTPPLSFTWDVGDGTILEGLSINHTYARPGTYVVKLTVQDGSGREASSTATVEATETGSGTVGGGGGSPGPTVLVLLLAIGAAIWIRRRR